MKAIEREGRCSVEQDGYVKQYQGGYSKGFRPKEDVC